MTLEQRNAGPFACPECSTTLHLDADRRRCENCGFRVAEQNGIPCFAPSQTADSTGWLSAEELEAFADRVEAGSIREATTECVVGNDRERELLSEIYGRRLDSWTVLVSQYVSGTCLEVNAGFGRRSTVLASLVESVYAVEENLSKLRVLGSRRDCSDGPIVPVQASTDRLPFAEGEFDVIVADFSGETPVSLEDRTTKLRRYLTDDGTLLVLFDGWVRHTGFLDRLNLDARSPDERSESLSSSLRRSLPRPIASEFEHSKLIGFLPSVRKPRYAFDVDDPTAAEWAVESAASNLHGGSPFTESVVGAVPSRVLRHCYPGYLAVITDAPRPPKFDLTSAVRIAGRARSVVIDLDNEQLNGILKIPNKPNHSPFTERENRIIAALQSSENPVRDTLPTGRERASRFGVVREEEPADGTPLGDRLDGSVDAFREALELGFDWLVRFQLAHRGERVVRSPTEVREDLTFEPGGVRPKVPSDPVAVFSAPIHGDYMPGNIYVEDGSVGTVIDWEYGALDGNPIVDAGFLLLFVSNLTFGAYEKGVRTVLCGDNPYSETAKACVSDYCDAVDLPIETFETYLPSVYVHRLELDWKHESVSTYDGTMADRVEFVEFLTDRIEIDW